MQNDVYMWKLNGQLHSTEQLKGKIKIMTNDYKNNLFVVELN
jgi:hypothetical protein